MDVRLPDGTVLQGIPDGTTKAQIAEKLQANGKTVPPDWLAPPKEGIIDRMSTDGSMGGSAIAAADAGASIVSGGVAASMAGLAGMAQGIKNRIQGNPEGNMSAADRVAQVQEGMTYQPRTKGGKVVTGAIAAPFELLAKAGDKVGQGAADVTGSPAVGAAVNTAIQSLPMLLAPELAGKGPIGKVIRGRKPVEPVPGPTPASPQGAPAAPPPLTLAENAYPRQPPSELPQGPPAPPPGAPNPAAAATNPPPGATPGATAAPKGPAGGTKAVPRETPAQKAEAYARSRAGLDWDRLSDSFKKTLTTIASESGALEKLTPDAVKRQGLLQSRRIPIQTTAGKLTRDATQLRNEANVAATDAGKPIRDIDVAANRDLSRNIELLATRARGQGKSAARAASPEQVGEAVQDLALRAKERVSAQNYSDLYKKARETEPDAEVNPAPMYKFLTKNPEVQHLNWLGGWLKKAKIEIPEDASASAKAGEPTSVTMRGVRLEELDDLRKKAVGIAKGGGTDAHYAGEVIKAIDQSFDEVPAAAKAWNEARAAFKAHKLEFEDTGAVERQVGMKSRTDRATALEDTWKKSIKTAKVEEIRQLKRSLLSGGNEATRLAGKQAIRELRSETVNQILKEARDKVVSTNEAGEQNLTAAALNKSINSIGRDRLTEILGRQTTRELYELLEAAKITKTEPAIRNAGSSTLQNLLAFIEKIPGVGGVLGGTARTLGKVKQLGEAGREVRKATTDPLEQAARKATGAQTRRRNTKKVAPAAPLTLRDNAPKRDTE